MSVEEAAEVIIAAIRSGATPDKIQEAIDQLNWTWEGWLENLPPLDES